MDSESREIFNPKTGSLISRDPQSESNFEALIGEILHQSIKKRKTIAEELSELTGVRVTEGMLNDWLAPSKPAARFPASLIKALCELTGDDRLARALLPERPTAALNFGEDVIDARNKLEKILAASKLLCDVRSLSPEKPLALSNLASQSRRRKKR